MADQGLVLMVKLVFHDGYILEIRVIHGYQAVFDASRPKIGTLKMVGLCQKLINLG